MALRDWTHAAVIVGGLLWLFAHYFPARNDDTELAESDELEVDAESTAFADSRPQSPEWNREYVPPPPPQPSWTSQDQATLDALRRNCQVATRNNADGEYPALQQMACTRLARFAAEHQINIGPLPEIRTASRKQPDSPPVVAHRAPAQDARCPSLIAEKEQIDQRMRQGYGIELGNRLRERLHVLYREIWELDCKLT